MPRTNSGEVQEILANNYDKKTPLTRFISVANSLVTRCNAQAIAKGILFTTSELQLLEAWLAAHYYMSGPDKGYTSRSTMGASGSFEGQTGKGLESTFYGQTAMDLDLSNFLRQQDKGQFAGAIWLGLPPSQQTPYDQRN